MNYETHTTPTDRLDRLNTEIEQHMQRLEQLYVRQKRFEGGIRYQREQIKTLMRYRNEVLEEMKEHIQ